MNPLNPPFQNYLLCVVETALLAVGTDIGNKLHILGTGTSEHEGLTLTLTSLTLTPLVPGDRATIQLLDQKFPSRSITQ